MSERGPKNVHQTANVSLMQDSTVFGNVFGGTARLRLTVPRPQQRGSQTTATRLQARNREVPFAGRDTELDRLRAWLEGGGQKVAVITGVGGSGKTRLALELVYELKEHWRAGFCQGPQRPQDLEQESPTLIVIDYAESNACTAALLEAVTRLDPKSAKTVRLVLIARQATDWLQRIRSKSDEIDDLLSDALELFLGAVNLNHEAEFLRALGSFTQEPVQALPPKGAPPQGRVLYVHIAALAASMGQPLQVWDQALDWVLVREVNRHWMRRVGEQTDGDQAQTAALLRRVMAAVTLRGGIEVATLPDLRQAALLGLRDTGRLEHHTRELEHFYCDGQRLPGLEPDLLGEHLVLKELQGMRELQPWLLGVVRPECAHGALTVLGRASEHDAGQDTVELAMQALLTRDPNKLAALVVQVTAELGSKSRGAGFGRLAAPLLDQALQIERPEVGRSMEEGVTRPTTALLELGELAVRMMRERQGLSDSERARLATNHGVWLNDIGRHEPALAAIEQAVEIRRALSRARPEAFEPDLASSLNNLSGCLSALGRHEPALAAIEQAVEIHRALSRARPEAFEPDLARSLGTMGAVLYNAEAAAARWFEALTLLRPLLAQNPQLRSLAQALEGHYALSQQA